MDPNPGFEAYLREIEHLPPAEQMELILGFFTKHAAGWDRATVALLRDYFATKDTPEGRTLAEVLEGQLALRSFREL